MVGDEVIAPLLRVNEKQNLRLAPVCQIYSPEFLPQNNRNGASELKQIAKMTGGNELIDLSNVWATMPMVTQDRNVSNYKLIFCIQNNKVTMYTFGMTSDEIDKCSKILDYYCKKYFGMEYHSSLLNQKVNAYSVDITFTNIQVISNFIMEMSNELQTKIDLLDSNAIVGSRLKEASE